MSVDLDMKEIERRAYMSYNEDGLIDILIGIIFLGWGIMLITDLSVFTFFLAMAAVGIWYSGKRYITIPRIGIMKPSLKMSNRMRNLAIAFLILGAITLAGIILVITLGSDDIASYSLGFVGLVIAAGLCTGAYFFNTSRLYAYAVLLFVAFAGGTILDGIITSFDAFIASVITAGAFILISGLVVLVRFLRKYPLPVSEA